MSESLRRSARTSLGSVGIADLTALNHRSHRRYSDRPVDDETLEILLSAAFSAPAKSDLQQSAVVIVRAPTKRAALADLVPSLDWVATCPVMMIFCADSRRIRKRALQVM